MATETATTNQKPFVHLHVHTQYSLLDGACRTKELVKRAKELGQPAVSITDHGCLFGVVDFYTKAKDVGSSRVDLQACKLEYSIVSPK